MRIWPLVIWIGILGCARQTRHSPDLGTSHSTPASVIEAPRIRRAEVAGSWYPSEAGALASYLDGLLDTVNPSKVGGPIIAMIAPHAGYRYSGKAAASGYALLRGQDIRRVVVLALSHHTALRGASIPDVTHFETPLGQIPLDGKVIALLRKVGVVKANAQAEVGEHSLEMQLPLLQRVLPRFSLIPILVGQMQEADYAALARALAGHLDHHTLVVASSDFTHRGANFRYEVPEGKGDIRQRLARVDDGSVAQILALSRRGFETYVRSTGATVCGVHPIALLLELLKNAHSVRGQVISRYTSGDVTSDWTSSVTYIDMAFTGSWLMGTKSDETMVAGKSAFSLTLDEKNTLLRLARSSLEAAVRKGAFDERVKDQFQRTASLERKAGAFVTLKGRMNDNGRCTARGHDLRGCIGTIESVDSILDVVARRAASAALEDTRFPHTVSIQELPYLSIEISVLTPPLPVKSSDDIVIGKHGIVLASGSHRATFLPQVAPEQGWNRETTLRHLARKAGLSEDGWKTANFQVYEAIVFGEDDGR